MRRKSLLLIGGGVMAAGCLALLEEREVRKRFGAGWDACAAATPRFIPRLVRSRRLPDWQ